MRPRRIACHRLILEDSSQLTLSVVEIACGEVTRWYPLNGETAHTELFSGTVRLKRNSEGQLRAWYEGKEIE